MEWKALSLLAVTLAVALPLKAHLFAGPTPTMQANVVTTGRLGDALAPPPPIEVFAAPAFDVRPTPGPTRTPAVATSPAPRQTSAKAVPSTIWTTGYALRGVMADGRAVHLGAAACPGWLKLGSVVLVDGLGQLVCEDRYPAAMADHVDVWRPTAAECFAITGRRWWRVLQRRT